MIDIRFVFFMFVFFMAVIGAMRGFAKELLVLFSAILAIFIILVFESYIGFYQAFVAQSVITRFWSRLIIILLLAFFGYQTPRIKRLQEAARREKFQDSVLGIVVGAANAFLIIGSIWFYLKEAGYQNFSYFFEPVAGTAMGDAAIRLVNAMPVHWALLDIPLIYFVIAVAFTFVVIVYV
jgi:uncharacterized membrane protein required for colicin V production